MAMRGHSAFPKAPDAIQCHIQATHCWVSHSLVEVSYPSAEMQSAYSTDPTNWTWESKGVVLVSPWQSHAFKTIERSPWVAWKHPDFTLTKKSKHGEFLRGFRWNRKFSQENNNVHAFFQRFLKLFLLLLKNSRMSELRNLSYFWLNSYMKQTLLCFFFFIHNYGLKLGSSQIKKSK